MYWADVSDWAIRIVGGLAALFIGLPLMVLFLQAIANIFTAFLALTVGLLYGALTWLWRQLQSFPRSTGPTVFSKSTPNSDSLTTVSPSVIAAHDSSESPATVPLYFQHLLLRLPQARCFEGALDGRRLVRVFGIRHDGASYDEDYEADHFWLVLEGDGSHEQIWLSIEWIIDIFTKLPGLHVRHCLVDAGTLLLLEDKASIFAPSAWQALIGMRLASIHSRSMYDDQKIAALALRFEKITETGAEKSLSASLLFDNLSDERWDAGIDSMLISGTGLHFALDPQALSFLNMPPRLWDKPWNIPSTPWNNRAHFKQLTICRTQLEGFTLWFETDARWRSPITPPNDWEAHAQALWQVLDHLSTWYILLAHGTQYQPHSWPDRDDEDYGPAWVSSSHQEIPAAQELAGTLPNWAPFLDEARWLSAPASDEPAAQQWQAELIQRITPVSQSFKAWKACFEGTMSRAT